jgi:hypothetical protein
MQYCHHSLTHLPSLYTHTSSLPADASSPSAKTKQHKGFSKIIHQNSNSKTDSIQYMTAITIHHSHYIHHNVIISQSLHQSQNRFITAKTVTSQSKPLHHSRYTTYPEWARCAPGGTLLWAPSPQEGRPRTCLHSAQKIVLQLFAYV